VDAEAAAERAGEMTLARRRADERERLQRQSDRARAESLIDRHVDHEVLHRAVEVLLDRDRQAMDLVDEQHVAALESGEKTREVGGSRERGTGGRVQPRRALARDQSTERRLAEARQSGEQHVVERIAAQTRRFDRDAEIPDHAFLADELVERPRAQLGFGFLAVRIGPVQLREGARLAHGVPAHCWLPSPGDVPAPAQLAPANRRRRKLSVGEKCIKRAGGGVARVRIRSDFLVHDVARHCSARLGRLARQVMMRPPFSPGTRGVRF
jgi:hypothetical protein